MASAAIDLSQPAGRLAAAEAAAEMAQEAGELLRGYRLRLGRVSSSSKSAPRDLVSAADLESEALLVQRLRERFPEHAIESEEAVQDARDSARPRWFLDPLDGTVNLVHGLPIFCVSMGLYLGQRPLAAVVHVPLLGETFVAGAGAGAFLSSPTVGVRQRLSVSSASTLGEAVLATGFPYRRNELANNNLGNFARLFYAVRGLRRMGSAAVDLCYVAAGRLDAYWELHLAPHDVAAGALMVLEAGGSVGTLDGGPDWLRGGQVVAGPPVLVEAIRSMAGSAPERLIAGPRP
jgi:myo-inositol-1(or 4)-monophosphatase